MGDVREEIAQLAMFGRAAFDILLEHLGEGNVDMDVESLSSAAIAASLLEEVPYDPDEHGDVEAEPGETILWKPDMVRLRPRQEGEG